MTTPIIVFGITVVWGIIAISNYLEIDRIDRRVMDSDFKILQKNVIRYQGYCMRWFASAFFLSVVLLFESRSGHISLPEQTTLALLSLASAAQSARGWFKLRRTKHAVKKYLHRTTAGYKRSTSR